jgi:hypothetical protein
VHRGEEGSVLDERLTEATDVCQLLQDEMGARARRPPLAEWLEVKHVEACGRRTSAMVGNH